MARRPRMPPLEQRMGLEAVLGAHWFYLIRSMEFLMDEVSNLKTQLDMVNANLGAYIDAVNEYIATVKGQTGGLSDAQKSELADAETEVTQMEDKLTEAQAGIPKLGSVPPPPPPPDATPDPTQQPPSATPEPIPPSARATRNIQPT